MPKVVIWASGYIDVFNGNDATEIKSITAGTWSPQSKDFKAAAEQSGDIALPAFHFGELLSQILSQPKGSIEKLGIIAHSNSEEFSLAGQIITTKPPNAAWNSLGTINATKLRDPANRLTVLSVRDRFAPNAYIMLFSCKTGGDGTGIAGAPVEEFQKAFDYLDYCCGFKTAVFTLVNLNRQGTKIIGRGKVGVDPTLKTDPNKWLNAVDSVWKLQVSRENLYCTS